MASPSSRRVAFVGSPVVAAAAPPSASRGVRGRAGEDPGQRAGRRARANHRGRHRRPDPGLLGLVRRAASDHLLRGSVFGVAATAVTSLLGFGYWFLAARLVPAATVGYASAVMSLVAGVGLLTGLGVNSLILERLPPLEGTPQWVEVVSSWLWPTTLLAAAVSAVVVLAGHASRAPVSGLELLVVMSTASAGVVVLGILDRVFLSARRADIGLLLAAATGVGKLASLLVLVVPGAALATLLGGWAVGVVAAAAAGCVLLVPRLRQGSLRLPQRWTKTREELKRVFGHHLTSVGGLLTPYLLPTIVVYRLDATHNAYFYASWMLGSVFLIISPAVASSLFVEGARDVGALARRTARALRILACLLPAPIIGAVVLGRPVLSLFGAGYAEHGYVLLMVLAASSVPDAVTNIAVAILRVRGRLRLSAVLNLVMAVLALAGAWVLLPSLGVAGAGVAWCGAQALGAVAVLPLLRTTLIGAA
ncbi:MAG: lipopolysaccharide biosynthesis protein [Pseudonocardiaceae bacterium]